MNGFEIPGHSLSFAKSWDIVCSCSASFGVDQEYAVAHLRLSSLPATTRHFCSLWKMKRSTARRWLLDHGCRMSLRQLRPGDDRRAKHEWVRGEVDAVNEQEAAEVHAG